jgi:tRNA dimethylallyltransferase
MQFRQDALRLISDIAQRGRLPLLVGGTMLYFKALREGLDELPPADPAIRARLDQEMASAGVPALHARLARFDPDTAARLPPNDTQRIQRALEIFEITGEPMSRLLARMPRTETPVSVSAVSLEPSQRAALHERIALRFNAMLDAPDGGLLAEVRTLRARGDLHPGLPSMRCVGYRQAWEHLDGTYDIAALRAKGIAATRQLAKRQLTWLRSMPDRTVIDCLDPAAPAKVLAQVRGAQEMHSTGAGLGRT